MSKSSLTAIILTFNEEIHLQRCIDSLLPVCKRILVVDSFSTDRTLAIAEANGAEILQNKWTNHAVQFNWGLDNSKIESEWILRMDADEYLTLELQQELIAKLHLVEKGINGIVLPLRRVFLNRHIKRGTGQINLLRIFRNGFGRSENRWMDEHIVLSQGETTQFEHQFADHNLNTISWWTTKHNAYAIREAIDLLDIEFNILSGTSHAPNLSPQALKKRQLKLSYAKKPLFLRSFAYFIYRYIFRLGFTEGKEGFQWHFLQGWWYRSLVDANIYEIKKACGTDPEKIRAYIREKHKLDV